MDNSLQSQYVLVKLNDHGVQREHARGTLEYCWGEALKFHSHWTLADFNKFYRIVPAFSFKVAA